MLHAGRGLVVTVIGTLVEQVRPLASVIVTL